MTAIAYKYSKTLTFKFFNLKKFTGIILFSLARYRLFVRF